VDSAKINAEVAVQNGFPCLCLQIVTILDPILFRSGIGLRDINTD
jgi:hypothetical protein